jgi:hypothetical protein
MSIPAIEAVRAYISGPGATLSTGQKLVLSDLAQVGDDHGVSFLSITGQAKQLGMARSSVQAARKELCDVGPLCVAEEVPGRMSMLWIDLPGLDGKTAESWRRRWDRRPAAVPVTGTPRNPSGSAVPVDETPGVPVPGGGVPVDERGGVPVDETRPVSRPIKDPLIDPLASENGSNRQVLRGHPENDSSRNGNGNPFMAVSESVQAAQATPTNEPQQVEAAEAEGDANGSQPPLLAAVHPTTKEERMIEEGWANTTRQHAQEELESWLAALPSMHSRPEQRERAERRIAELRAELKEAAAA